MNVFDTTIMTHVNQLAQHWLVFDKIVKAIAVSNLFKGGILALILWWIWFTGKENPSRRREYIISTLIAGTVAVAIVELLVVTLPFRPRPVYDPSFNFAAPFGMTSTALEDTSSFPSDHAALFFALAVGLLFVSRKMGILVMGYTCLFILFPRIYIGLHWPTDILAGMAIATVVTVLCNIYLARSKYLESIADWSDTHPALFYPSFFFITYQVADLFQSSREVAGEAFKLLRMIFS